jgi:hypothetical protein
MWSIVFVLPNIKVEKPIGNEWISIVPHDDARISETILTNPFTRALVENFEDQFERKVYPSLLIVKNNAPDHIRDIEAIVGFRNAFALSTIIMGHEHSLTSKFVAYPLYSDYFDIYPITISRDNDGFITRSPSVLGFDDEYKNFRGQRSPSLAGLGSVSVRQDDRLFNLLERIWERRFVKRKLNEWPTRALFRSLEMAYQATTIPFKNHSTIYDYGSSASLWVSAFDILTHPRKGKTGLLSVLNLLGTYEWDTRVIKRKSYKVKYGKRDHQVNLVQKLYKELYDTRNDFLHGNPVKPDRLYPFRNKNTHLITRYAPIIYKVALQSFLNQFEDKRQKKDWQKEYISKLFNERKLSEAILSARKLKIRKSPVAPRQSPSKPS